MIPALGMALLATLRFRAVLTLAVINKEKDLGFLPRIGRWAQGVVAASFKNVVHLLEIIA